MGGWIFSALAISLSVTLILELGFSAVAGLRGRSLQLVALVNLLTNPAIVYLFFFLSAYTEVPRLLLLLSLEGLAIWAEGFCFARYGKGMFSHPYRFSLLVNLFSYTVGSALHFFLSF